MEAQKAVEQLRKIADISSPYAQPNADGKSMIVEIERIKNDTIDKDAEFLYCLGVAYRNYCAWFVRGDERKGYLEMCVSCLKEAIIKDKDKNGARIELAHLLIEEASIRDLDQAISICRELKSAKLFPDWMDSSFQKALRWSGKGKLQLDNDFSMLSPFPAVLHEERTKLRKILAEKIKENDEIAKVIGLRLYNLSIFSLFLQNTDREIINRAYDHPKPFMKKWGKQFNFDYIGRIESDSFLSELDYKRLEKLFKYSSEIFSKELLPKSN